MIHALQMVVRIEMGSDLHIRFRELSREQEFFSQLRIDSCLGFQGNALSAQRGMVSLNILRHLCIGLLSCTP